MAQQKINNHHGYKTFLCAIEIVNEKPQEIKSFLEDNRLTSLEKKLLVYCQKIRSKNFECLDDLLADDSYKSYPFLLGMKFYLLGFGYICKADNKKSEEFFKKAEPLIGEAYNESFFRHLSFRLTVNQFYIYVNLKQMSEVESQFQKVKQLSPIKEEEKINVKLAELCYFIVTAKYPQAEELLEEFQLLMPVMNEIQICTLLIEKFDFYVKIEAFKKAEKTLGEMKSYRSYRLSANYKYMHMMVKHLIHGERLYIYEKDFAGHTDLHLMVMVIKALDEANWEEAKNSWEALSETSSETYLPDFVYKGDKCLFSISLARSQVKLGSASRSQHFDERIFTSHELKIINAIKEASASQIKKEDLFFQLNGKELSSKEELSALTAAIYRINKKGSLQIKSKKGSYCIEQTFSQAV